jgi:hypothetical protein
MCHQHTKLHADVSTLSSLPDRGTTEATLEAYTTNLSAPAATGIGMSYPLSPRSCVPYCDKGLLKEDADIVGDHPEKHRRLREAGWTAITTGAPGERRADA